MMSQCFFSCLVHNFEIQVVSWVSRSSTSFLLDEPAGTYYACVLDNAQDALKDAPLNSAQVSDKRRCRFDDVYGVVFLFGCFFFFWLKKKYWILEKIQ